MARFRGKFNGELVKEPLSKEAIYWFGLLITDGCLHKGKYAALGLGLKDKDHVNLFAKYCGVNSYSLDSISNQKGIQTGSAVLFGVSPQHEERLNHYGIVPRKSGKEIPPKELIDSPDWWRGVIDGDGSLGFYKRCPVISLCGSIQLITSFTDLVKKLTNGHTPVIRKISDNDLYQASAGGGENSKPVIDWIYYPGCYPVLERKNILAKQALSWIKYPNKGELASNAKLSNAQVRAVRKDPRSHRAISKDYGVSATCISYIKSGHSYSSVV